MAPASLQPASALLLLLGPILVQPAPRAPLLGPALVQPTPQAPRQLPVWGRVDARTRANTKASVDGLAFGSFLSRSVGLATQLLGPQMLGAPSALVQLGALGGEGADAVLSLFEASVGASSGGHDNPAAVGTADSSEEVADLVV